MSTRFRRIRKILSSLQTAWSIAGVSVVLVVVLEAGFRVGFAIKDWRDDSQAVAARRVAEAQGDPVWPLVNARELGRLADRFSPWVYFRQRPFHGQTITIDENGRRATWQPPGASESRAGRRPLVVFLGGSTLWGYGARDMHTIPSLVAQRLFERGRAVDVQNQAEIGYVSTQELVALQLELRDGLRPDVVVFFDGVNDTTSAALEGHAGLSTNESNRVAEFNLRQSAPRLGRALGARLIEDSGLYRFARFVRRRLGAGGLDMPRSFDPRLASDVAECYAGNVAIIRGLGRQYGFRPFFFWQPVVFTKTTRTALEQDEAARFAPLESIFRAVHEQLKKSPELASAADYHDLSALFDNQSDGAFIDYCHTTEKANERIADLMREAILEALP